MSVTKKNHPKLTWSAFLLVPVLTASLIGCAIPLLEVKEKIPFLKTKETPKTISSTLKYDPQSGKITQAGLQAEVMDFSDQYVLLFWQALDEIIRSGVPVRDRIRINRVKVMYCSAALAIASGRNPAANLLDMVVFITVGRMAVEDYWAPQVYAPKGKVLLEAYWKLEKEIWDMAAQVLPPHQLEILHSLINQWRAAHPKQYYVSYVRLSEFATLRGASPLEKEDATHGLLAEVEKALVKVDEAFLLAERGMFYVQRASRIMTLQTELIIDEATTNLEVQQVVKNVDRAVDSLAGLSQTAQKLPGILSAERQAIIKQLGDWADTERQKLINDLESEEPRLKGLLPEVRETLLAGTELAKAAGALTNQLQPVLNAPQASSGMPVDYIQTMKQVTETLKQTTILVKSLDDFVVGETVEEAKLVKVLRQVNAEIKATLNHAFWLSLILIVSFLIGLVAALVSYQFITRRIVK